MRKREEVESFIIETIEDVKKGLTGEVVRDISMTMIGLQSLLTVQIELLLDIRDLLTPEIKIEDEKEVKVYRNDFEGNRFPTVSIITGKEWISLRTWNSLTMIKQGSGLCFEFEGQFFYLYIQSVTVSTDNSGYDLIKYKGISLSKEELELQVLQGGE